MKCSPCPTQNTDNILGAAATTLKTAQEVGTNNRVTFWFSVVSFTLPFGLTKNVAPISTFLYYLAYVLPHAVNKSLGCPSYVASIAITRKFIYNIHYSSK